MVQTSLPTCQEEAQVDQKGFIVQALDSTPWTTSLNFGRTTTSPHLSPLYTCEKRISAWKGSVPSPVQCPWMPKWRPGLRRLQWDELPQGWKRLWHSAEGGWEGRSTACEARQSESQGLCKDDYQLQRVATLVIMTNFDELITQTRQKKRMWQWPKWHWGTWTKDHKGDQRDQHGTQSHPTQASQVAHRPKQWIFVSLSHEGWNGTWHSRTPGRIVACNFSDPRDFGPTILPTAKSTPHFSNSLSKRLQVHWVQHLNRGRRDEFRLFGWVSWGASPPATWCCYRRSQPAWGNRELASRRPTLGAWDFHPQELGIHCGIHRQAQAMKQSRVLWNNFRC